MTAVMESFGETANYIYVWGNNATRAALKDRPCRIIFKGKMNSVLVEFEGGGRVVTSIRALKKKSRSEDRLFCP